MMSDRELPHELAELERALVAARYPVGTWLESRVRIWTRQALASERQRRRMTFALSAAAVMLIGLHVSWWGSSSMVEAQATHVDSTQLASVAQRLSTMLPDLPAAEVKRQARLMLLSGNGGPAPPGQPLALPRPFVRTTNID